MDRVVERMKTDKGNYPLPVQEVRSIRWLCVLRHLNVEQLFVVSWRYNVWHQCTKLVDNLWDVAESSYNNVRTLRN